MYRIGWGDDKRLTETSIYRPERPKGVSMDRVHRSLEQLSKVIVKWACAEWR